MAILVYGDWKTGNTSRGAITFRRANSKSKGNLATKSDP